MSDVSNLGDLRQRLQRLEASNRRMRWGLAAATLLAFSCGAATTTARYGQVGAHRLGVLSADESAELLVLKPGANGGVLSILDSQGHERVVIDADGVRVYDDQGSVDWNSVPPS